MAPAVEVTKGGSQHPFQHPHLGRREMEKEEERKLGCRQNGTTASSIIKGQSQVHALCQQNPVLGS